MLTPQDALVAYLRSATEAAGKTRPAAEVEPRRVSWIWQDYVPSGMLTVLAGLPGLGKSTIALELAARISRDGLAVIVASGEDPAETVIRPRLEAAGADLDLVHLWVGDLELPDGAEALEAEVRRLKAALVVIDPLNAFLAIDTNSHRDHHVRRVLRPLAELAEGTGAAVLVAGHLNKGSGSEPLLRVGGSIGLVAAARQVLVAASDGDRTILAVAKSNVGRIPPPVAYRIEPVLLDGSVETARIAWLGEAPDVDLRALLAPAGPEERSLAEEVAEVLRTALAGGPRPAREVEREIREALGDVSHGVIVKARRIAGVAARKRGFGEGWDWYLQEESREESRRIPELRDSSARPAETAPQPPEESRSWDGDSSRVVYIDGRPCVRCLRYGPGHIGEHIAEWPGVTT